MFERQKKYRTQVHGDLASIGRAAWNALVAADGEASPFVEFDYLHALAASGCTNEHTGWTPSHLTLWREQHLVAAAPLYIKDHSYGEYVFDWGWAEAAQRAGIAYYPKLLSAVPFTPVGSTRLIAADDEARAELARALLAHARASRTSSLHVLFAPPPQIALLAAGGMLRRHGVQFHWTDRGFANFDDFLAALAQPKRKKIRAERRKVRDAGVALERKVGREITESDWSFFHSCYQTTYAAHWSTPYLNLDFFLRLADAMPERLLLVLARRAGRPIAASMGVFDIERGYLYGRYWGAIEHVPCLHFEACYYQMIAFAIERGLRVFEGGAQGAHKMARGFDPVPTLSAHWLADPRLHSAVARFLEREAVGIAGAIDELQEHRAFRSHVAIAIE